MKPKLLPDPLSERWQRLLEGLAAECYVIRETQQGRDQRRAHLRHVGMVCEQIARQALAAYQQMEAPLALNTATQPKQESSG